MFNHIALNQDLKIIRFGGDFRPLPEVFTDLEMLIKENEDLYPGIDIWFDKKVVMGLKSEERRAFVVYCKDKPVGAAVIKLGKDTKICSVRLSKEQQGKGLGYIIFSILAMEMRHFANKVHFTTPESLWINKNDFFENFGFKYYNIANQQYRLWEDEFLCGTEFSVFWKNMLRILPKAIENFTINGNVNHCDIVLSIKPDYANRLVNGEKKIEIRRRFSKKWQRSKAFIYSSSPQKHFVGEALIGDVYHATPNKIWHNFGSEIGCSQEDFKKYCDGAEKVYAITFSDVKKFKYSLPAIQIETLIKQNLKAPQSYCEVKKDTVWPLAISISSLLRANIK